MANVIRLGCLDRHPGLIDAGLEKFLRHAPAAVVVTTHDEADAARGGQANQPGRRIAAVEHENVVRTGQIKGFAEHAALAQQGAVYAGVQGQFIAGCVFQPIVDAVSG